MFMAPFPRVLSPVTHNQTSETWRGAPPEAAERIRFEGQVERLLESERYISHYPHKRDAPPHLQGRRMGRGGAGSPQDAFFRQDPVASMEGVPVVLLCLQRLHSSLDGVERHRGCARSR